MNSEGVLPKTYAYFSLFGYQTLDLGKMQSFGVIRLQIWNCKINLLINYAGFLFQKEPCEPY